MNQPTEPTPPFKNSWVQIFTLIFVVLGIVLFQFLADNWFPRSPGEFNYKRILAAAAVGGASALIGALVGKLAAKLFR